jgi:dihydroorotase-like cyclic amidohydrolase
VCVHVHVLGVCSPETFLMVRQWAKLGQKCTYDIVISYF